MDFRVLGPVAASTDGIELALGGQKQRAVLAMLVLRAGRVVSVDQLVDGVWGEEAPLRAPQTLQVYVSTLRGLMGHPAGSSIRRKAGGYVLDVDPDATDVGRFERKAQVGVAAFAAGRQVMAASALHDALAEWRGPALLGLEAAPFAASEANRLELRRQQVLEQRIAADLALGRAGSVVDELESLVAAHSLHEPFWAQLMLALYRCGRQADALQAFQRARLELRDELGLDPGPELRILEAAILAQDPSIATPAEQRGSRTMTNPPEPATALIGRAVESERIDRLLADDGVRLITVTGFGGIGKTHLALECARRHATDPAVDIGFVDLSEVTDPTRVLAAAAEALDVAFTDRAEFLGSVAGALDGRRTVLLIDNVEQLVAAGPDLAALLGATPSLTVLATSRVVLRVRGEHEVALAPLSLPSGDDLHGAAAGELFAERAASLGVTLRHEDLPTVVEICRLLDGLPLAVELAVARLRVLTPAMLLTRLEDRLAVLTGGDRDLPDRHRSLRATLDWSVDLLAADTAELLATVGVFVGRFSLEQLEAVAEPDVGSRPVLDRLQELVEAALVHPAGPLWPGRFTTLQTVRAYACELADEALGGLRARHASHFLAQLTDAAQGLDGPAELTVAHGLDADLPDVRQAIEWALTHNADDDVASAVVASLSYFQARGLEPEAATILTRASANGLRPDIDLAATATRGRIAYYLDNFEQAQLLLSDALARARAAQATVWTVYCLAFLGPVRYLLNDPEVDALAEEAMQLARPIGGRVLRQALSLAAFAASLHDDRDAMMRLTTESLALARQLGDARLVSYHLLDVVGLAIAEERFDDAGTAARQSLDVARTIGDAARELDALFFVALTAVWIGDATTALRYGQEVLAMAEAMELPATTARCLRLLGAGMILDGHLAHGVRLFGASHALSIADTGDERVLHVLTRQLDTARAQIPTQEFERLLSEGHHGDRTLVVSAAMRVAAS